MNENISLKIMGKLRDGYKMGKIVKVKGVVNLGLCKLEGCFE